MITFDIQRRPCEPMALEALKVHPLAEKFPDLPAEEFGELKRSIEEIGLLEPLIINDQNQILDGRHRYRACAELNLKDVPTIN